MAKLNKRRPGVKKLAAVILIFFIIFCLLSMGGSALIFRILFVRSEKSTDTLELNYNDVDSEKYPRSEFVFTSGNNTLQGYLYETANSPGIIIIVHGMNACADSHLPEVLYFLDNGWSVFCFDGTGSGESEGKSVVGLSQMKLDLLGALEHISKSFPDSPLLLFGHSMGAYASAAVLNDWPSISAAVLISAFDSPVETMYYHASQYVGPLATIGYPFLCLHNIFLFGSEANESAVSSINQTEATILIVQGSKDDVIPDKISLFGRRAMLTNHNVSYTFVEEEHRNLHSTPWLSAESAAYRAEMEQRLEYLHSCYGSVLPDSVSSEFLRQLDRNKLFDLDDEFMEQIHDFYLNSIKNKTPQQS